MTFALKTIQRDKAKFLAFVAQNGGEVLEPTNEFEVLRFRSGITTSVIYRKATGQLTFTGDSLKAFTAFKSNAHWRAMPAARRSKRSGPRMQAIRKRDGDGCFYCLLPVSVDEESEEHLVSVTHGGPTHISNLFLTHRVCNSRAGHLSAPEKIKLHVEAHMKGMV